MERGGRTEGGITEVRRGAVTRGRRRGSNLSGLGPGKRKERARPKSPSASLLVPAPPTRTTMNGDGETEGGNGAEAASETGGGIDGRAPWFIGRRCRFGNRPWAVKARAGTRRSRPRR
uniref:Transposon protein, putative, unclassified n=2 Tax=Oryza sativa subsp. japonica TaxID=39947 RepID=Q2R773_ORYSJ|nr:transposon protein, putative, unclassified [Oryza sativa Japonica Group]ABA92622.1 transposon protein, putative, unclassified [Oryza sativa Japonica Group]